MAVGMSFTLNNSSGQVETDLGMSIGKSIVQNVC